MTEPLPSLPVRNIDGTPHYWVEAVCFQSRYWMIELVRFMACGAPKLWWRQKGYPQPEALEIPLPAIDHAREVHALVRWPASTENYYVPSVN